jgi:hypothetical protein
MTKATSEYLNRPLRTLEQALADLAKRQERS